MRSMRMGEVSAALDTSPKTIRHWLETGALRGGRTPGNRWRVTDDEVLRMQRKLAALD